MGAVAPVLVLVRVQRRTPICVQSAAIMHRGITMESGHVRDVKPFLKEAFKDIMITFAQQQISVRLIRTGAKAARPAVFGSAMKLGWSSVAPGEKGVGIV